MSHWRRCGDCWTLWPRQPQGIVEFLGGSYLAATPHISYGRLLEGLASNGLAVHAWSYVPGFDHQLQARQAWDAMRRCRSKLQDRTGTHHTPLRLGHSLGCKLHLLAPDGGRGCHTLVALSFNNFTADQSIPLLGVVAPTLGVSTEFSPSPQETLRLIADHYHQPRNLVVRFGDDQLDQSPALLSTLKGRPNDASEGRQLKGDHLTPASAGLRRKLLGDWAEGEERQQQVEQLQTLITGWAQASCSS
ncbi:MAG: DUF1350 family protein [Synechococcus sp.]